MKCEHNSEEPKINHQRVHPPELESRLTLLRLTSIPCTSRLPPFTPISSKASDPSSARCTLRYLRTSPDPAHCPPSPTYHTCYPFSSQFPHAPSSSEPSHHSRTHISPACPPAQGRLPTALQHLSPPGPPQPIPARPVHTRPRFLSLSTTPTRAPLGGT